MEKINMKNKIAPSILSVNLINFSEIATDIEEAGVDYLHIDIMDGHFVDNLTFGADVVAALRSCSRLFFDCHLMVENAEKYVDAFAKAGADSLTIHVETTPHIHRILQKIKEANLKAAIAINPGTPVEAITSVLNIIDMVLVMTVNPGFSGQSFIPETLDKVSELAKLREKKKLDFDIEVDGGIDDKTIAQAREAGANVFVAGNFIFKGNVLEQINKLKEQL